MADDLNVAFSEVYDLDEHEAAEDTIERLFDVDALRRYFELGVHHALSVIRDVAAGKEGPYFDHLRTRDDLLGR